jgi:chromosome segregation protein
MTRLTALELFGFKSFADRTRFEFPEGITVVVGPNGSGKSNVVDAIKWVLGEQSVRSLRGKEMTDVIFAGSAARKPLNMAEVSLFFDNTARQLPVQGDEVRIARRVYRNGESEYLVNGEPARLRDIRELFSGTGAATEAYSVIEQGRVDALLVASGRDRRAVFEEAAGITRFRTRRAEALRRLERSEQNRQRLADIVGEVGARLETVRHQAARARRWKSMQARLRRFRLAAANRDLATIDATITELQDALATARADADANEARSATAALTAAELVTRIESLAPRLAVARDAAAAAIERAAAAEATESLQRGRRGEFTSGESRAEASLAGAIRDARAAERAQAAADTEAATMTEALTVLEARLAACERAAAGSLDDDATARAALTEATAALDLARQRRVRAEAEHDREAGRLSDARAAADAAREAAASARDRLGGVGEARAACEGHLAWLEGRLAAASSDVESLGAAKRAALAAVQTAWRDLAERRAAREACRERLGMLRELVARQEGVSDAARMLLADGAAAALPGFRGVLADRIVARAEWAPLVDIALGTLGQSLVVGSLDDAIGWHADWSATADAARTLAAGGTIGLLATSHLREPDAFEPDPAHGIVGRLDRLLLADSTDTRPAEEADLVRRLLGRVWIVEGVEHALPLVASAPADTLFLTRDGVALAASGSLTIGQPVAPTGLVARRAELRGLDERHMELDRAVAAAQAAIDELEAVAAARDDELADATARRQQSAETIASSRAELARVIRDQRAAEDAVGAADRTVRTADQRVVAAESVAADARTALAAAEETLTAALAAADVCRTRVEAIDRSHGAAVDELHRLAVERATTAEKLARFRDVAAAAALARRTREAEVTAARIVVTESRDRALGHDLEILAATAMRAEAATAAERATAALRGLADEAARLEDARREATAAIDDTRTAATSLSGRVHALELEAGEAGHQRARVVERIRDEYDIDIDAPQPAEEPATADDAEPVPDDRAELEARIEELRRKLATMTSVNLEALAECEALAERLATLEAQLADVTSAAASIGQLIAKIDDESRRLLGDTIETVRGHFRDLFERVFGGGQADIVLEPGVDLLETSVEIVARPPGKEPRSISLLSGGEKTMTCVALLLAIFKSRPSPFCVLDEVDAALDEANVDRFVGVLRDFLASTQFIVVTHSKKTMASATTLYGVTMEESGVSKRVSVRFESTSAATVPVSRAA